MPNPNPPAPRPVSGTPTDEAFQRGYDLGMSERAAELAANKRLLDAAYQRLAAVDGQRREGE